MASSIKVNLGLVWFIDSDPTAGAGLPAPLNQFAIRTDVPSLYYKSGASNTAWTLIGAGLGGGFGSFGSLIPGFFDDFVISNLSTVNNTAGGASTFGLGIDNAHPGTVTQSAAAAAADATRILAGGNNNATTFGGGVHRFDWIFQIPTLADGVNNFNMRGGMHDGAGLTDAVDGAYLEYDFGVFGDQKFRLCASNNSVRTKVDTGIAAVAGTIYHAIINVDAAGTLVTASINGVASANSVNANIPTTTARAFNVANLQLSKTLGAVSRSVISDMYSWQFTPTTPR